MSWKPGITYCEGDGCALFGTCPKSLTKAVKDDAYSKGKIVEFFKDPLKLTCWTERIPSWEEATDAINRIDPPPQEPIWD